MRPHPRRASVNPRSPRGWGTCDRSGFITNHEKLAWQFDWRGAQLVNLKILVAPDMLDKPQRQLGTIILPPDPEPILNARPEPYTMEEGSAFALVQQAAASSVNQAQCTVSLPRNPMQGNLVVLGVVFNGITPSLAASDARPNVYTLTPAGITTAMGTIVSGAAEGTSGLGLGMTGLAETGLAGSTGGTGGGSASVGVCVFYLPNVPPGALKAITVTAPNTLLAMETFVAEFSGASVLTFDNEVFTSGLGVLVNQPTIKTNYSDLLFAVIQVGGLFSAANPPWTALPAALGDAAAYSIQTAAGSQAANFTQQNLATWNCQIVAFR